MREGLQLTIAVISCGFDQRYTCGTFNRMLPPSTAVRMLQMQLTIPLTSLAWFLRFEWRVACWSCGLTAKKRVKQDILAHPYARAAYQPGCVVNAKRWEAGFNAGRCNFTDRKWHIVPDEASHFCRICRIWIFAAVLLVNGHITRQRVHYTIRCNICGIYIGKNIVCTFVYFRHWWSWRIYKSVPKSGQTPVKSKRNHFSYKYQRS